MAPFVVARGHFAVGDIAVKTEADCTVAKQAEPTSSSLLVVGLAGARHHRNPEQPARGGARRAACYASFAASFFAPVRLVGVVGSDFPRAHEDLLRSRNIHLARPGTGVWPYLPLGWALRGRLQQSPPTLDTQLNVFETFRPKLPASYADSAFVFLANIDPVLQLEVLGQVRRPRFVPATP